MNPIHDVIAIVKIIHSFFTKEMYLVLTGSSLAEWAGTENAVTGLYPFMTMATKSKDCIHLEEVYEFAMMNLNSILQRDLPARNTKYSGSKLTIDRNVKRMKRV